MPTNTRSGIRTPIWVSQNFLTSAKTIQTLIRRTSLSADDHVVEIGPGKGHITRELLGRCKQVSAIELDAVLHEKLQVKLEFAHNLKLYKQDFMSWNLPKTGMYKVFSNIPFHMTTDILRKLSQCKNPPVEAWLIMEKGAAKRFMGYPKESLRSLLIKPLFEMKIVHHFKKEDFHPCPSVQVVMLHLKRKPQPDVASAHWDRYAGFIEQAMKSGRQGLLRSFTKKQLSLSLREAGIHNDFVPAETLYIQWLCLFRCSLQYTR